MSLRFRVSLTVISAAAVLLVSGYKREELVRRQLETIFEISQATFFKEDYAGIKEFFNRMYALMNEEIVLKKKN